MRFSSVHSVYVLPDNKLADQQSYKRRNRWIIVTSVVTRGCHYGLETFKWSVNWSQSAVGGRAVNRPHTVTSDPLRSHRRKLRLTSPSVTEERLRHHSNRTCAAWPETFSHAPYCVIDNKGILDPTPAEVFGQICCRLKSAAVLKTLQTVRNTNDFH